MRNYTAKLFTFPNLRIIPLLFAAFILITGCKKDEENTPKYSNLMFIHAIPDAAPMDLFIDKKSASTNIPFGSSTIYHEVTAGNHQVTATETGTIQEKINTSHGFQADSKFSIVAFNTNASPQSIVITDTVATPSSTKAWVRFLNLSPANNNYSYVVRLEGSTQIFEFGARDFKGVSNYREYDPNTYTFNAVNIKATNTNTAASTGAITLEGGKIYTLILTGTEASSAPHNLTLQAVVNK